MIAPDAPTVPLGPTVDGDAPTYGRFVARGLLGRGGMGVVVRAHDPELDREVALKLLSPDAWGATEVSLGEQQVRAEAQALARLKHPNVVTVYETGRVGATAFIAMELIEGESLRRWLARAHPVADVVRMFVACGRGLAAAHAAGLVHRDFKPDNVLIADGRPRVTDFGLVTRGVAADGTAIDGGDRVRVDGAIVGTPPYMAPEQWRGDAVDARTDQFAFCVALWEALAGGHPFGGGDGDARRAAVLGGALVAPRRPMARRLEAALRRGLARERTARWPTMDALLAALERAIEPSRARWIAAAAIAALALGGGALWLARDRGHADACAADVGPAWTAATRDAVAAALARGAAANDPAPAAVVDALDAYAMRWEETASDACRSGAARTPAMRETQAICLDRARLALAGLTTALAGDAALAEVRDPAAARDAIAQARLAVARLPDLEACADVERLATVIAPPADPALRRRLAAVREQLAAAASARMRGDPGAAQAAVVAAVAEARAIGYAPTVAEALRTQGDLAMDRGDLAAAEATFRDAATAAADGRDDETLAYAWTRVIFVAAERQESLAAAAAMVPVADAALRRAGDPQWLRFMFESSVGTLAARRGDHTRARDHFTAALAASSSDLEGAQARTNLANSTWMLEGAAAALPTLRDALAAFQATRGPDHPDTADAMQRAGACANAAGEFAEARDLLERALAIQERTWGPNNLNVASTLEGLGNTTSNLHDYAASLAYFDRAIAAERTAGAPAIHIATTEAARAIMLIEYRPEEALAALPPAIERFGAAAGTDNTDYRMMRASLADLLARLGRCGDATAILRELDALSAEPYPHAFVLSIEARCARDDGRAIATYEQALARCGADDCDPITIALLHVEHGRRVHRRDPARGRALVDEAVQALRAADPIHPALAEHEAWLAARPQARGRAMR